KRVSVYICHCGGNISDYVDVTALRDELARDPEVVVSKHLMFACSDASQKEMEKDIREQGLDAMVVASCSPKPHTHTFRNVAARAGLNPYKYVQVNIREQCSWAHSDHSAEATLKASGLVRAGKERVLNAEALTPIRVESKQAVAVIGAGVSGLRAAMALADLGEEVYLVESAERPGGRVAARSRLFPDDSSGASLVDRMVAEVKKRPSIKLFTKAAVQNVSGSIGNFTVKISVDGGETLPLGAGAILVATGYDDYRPAEGEFGFATGPDVMTLPDFDALLESGSGDLKVDGRVVKRIAFVYCIGMRQAKGPNAYCSRVCCTAAISSSLAAHERAKGLDIYHVYRDIRTYGKQESLYEASSKAGDTYIMYSEKSPPLVERRGKGLRVSVKDSLIAKAELQMDVDLLVLVTGMVPRSDSAGVASLFKIPTGTDKFFNEIHPKLRPVETVINGIYLGGSCQGPKTIAESVQSSLAAAAKIYGVIGKGTIELEPIVARVHAADCAWCGKCQAVCDYGAITQAQQGDSMVAMVNSSACVGCGMCAPVCPSDAIDLARYTNAEVESMIDAFSQAAGVTPLDLAQSEAPAKEITQMMEFPARWNSILEAMGDEPMDIPSISTASGFEAEDVTFQVMTMVKYRVLVPTGIDDDDEYYFYQRKR
ncbi:MAG: FAD-dependent oxidoreductase, partial [Spirochaetota bacterium]